MVLRSRGLIREYIFLTIFTDCVEIIVIIRLLRVDAVPTAILKYLDVFV